MKLIFDGLKAGERYPFDLLATHYEEVAEFWDWWWQQADENVLTRPYTIADEDPALEATLGKTTVDTETHSAMFWDFLLRALSLGCLPRGSAVPRVAYRTALVRHLAERAPRLASRTVVFVGGGYGAGKTTTLSMLAACGVLPFSVSALLGVDYCKLHLPEFERAKTVADGRASSITQEESRLISDDLFSLIIAEGRSFAWDSSMSNREESIRKIAAARAAGYRVQLIAVWTPPERAIPRAMRRARETRRFAHPDHLVPSAKKFAQYFPEYCDLCDTVQVYWNGDDARTGPEAQPLLIAEKPAIEFELASFHDALLETLLEFGRKP